MVDGVDDHYVHDNHMVFGIVCCFVCFMFLGSAFMEKGEWACTFIYVGFCSSWRLVGIWF